MNIPFDEKSREEQLKEVVKKLHQGAQVKNLKHEFRYLLEHLSAEEVASMEQSLVNEGFPVESIQELCEIHVDVFEQALQKNFEEAQQDVHPVSVFKRENRELETRLKEIKQIIKDLKKHGRDNSYATLLKKAEDLRNFEKHYLRKENQLFPKLEALGFTGPSSVMWGKHDEIRGAVKSFINSARTKASLKVLKSDYSTAARKMEKMIFMEEKILFPTSLKKLSEEDWNQIRREEDEIGLAWIESYRQAEEIHQTQLPPSASRVYNSEEENMMSKPIQIPLDEGFLTQQQLDLMLRALPFDITFVDEHDQVRYYSATDDRIFPRTPSIIGRDVKNCHPPKSVHIVEKIVQSFKSKERDSAEFWIQLQGKTVHIRYYPLFDAAGAYRGTIEISQDITEIQNIEGERRLLDWE